MDAKKMWGGRFTEKTAGAVEEYTESVSFDQKLYGEDIFGSKAHVSMLAEAGIVSCDERDIIISGLDTILKEIEEGKFIWREEDEDVHMNIERRLIDIVGAVGGKLHTGRSRNDQVATDFRLYVSRSLRSWHKELLRLIDVFSSKAEENIQVYLPGCTHMQPAQPVSLAQHLLAYVQMFSRDAERVASCLERVEISPLGAAALAGTTYPISPERSAELLGFGRSFENSMDAVSDRDFVVEAIFCGSLVMMHLSRICEELIIWANPLYGYIRLPDAYSTGSSIMPQKKNPDVCELMRGKVGRVYGSLISLLTILKAAPMTYNRDMQEDKEPFFDTDKTVLNSVSIMADMMKEIVFEAEAMEKGMQKGYINATELADYLANKGIPFRDAHHITGELVGYAERNNKGLEALSLEEFQNESALIEEDVYKILEYKVAAERRVSAGGTSSKSIKVQLANLKKWRVKEEEKLA